MQKSARKVTVVAFCIVIVGLLLHVWLGSTDKLGLQDIVREIFRGWAPRDITHDVVWQIRLPRAIEAVLVGAILGVSGTALQNLFRNQLAEPYIVGASSGAAIGAALVGMSEIATPLLTLAMPLAGFVTGFATLLLVISLAKRRGVVETQTLLLAGVVVSTMLSALLSFIILASGKDQRVVMRWILGQFDTANWQQILLIALVLLISYLFLHFSTQKLNAMSLGEEGAQALGVDPKALRLTVLICVTAMTSVTVGAVGVIGFVGLVAPHISRRIVGPDLRANLPLSALIGSMLMIIADLIAQRGMQGAGFPVGIVTAILGAPVLLILLKRR